MKSIFNMVLPFLRVVVFSSSVLADANKGQKNFLNASDSENIPHC